MLCSIAGLSLLMHCLQYQNSITSIKDLSPLCKIIALRKQTYKYRDRDVFSCNAEFTAMVKQVDHKQPCC